jgi:hypothetical protein
MLSVLLIGDRAAVMIVLFFVFLLAVFFTVFKPLLVWGVADVTCTRQSSCSSGSISGSVDFLVVLYRARILVSEFTAIIQESLGQTSHTARV